MQKNLLQPVTASLQVSLDRLMLAAPVAILVADQEGTILFSNQRLNALFGYEKDDLFGTSIEQLLPEASRSIHVQHRHGYMTAPRVRSMGSGMDLIGLRKDGTTFPIEVGLSHLEIDGHLVVMASVVDISVRKRTEEVLEQRVTERTRELDRRRRISDGLVTVLAMINANYPLDEILNAILGHATLILKVDACALVRNLVAGGCEVQVARNLPFDYGQSLSHVNGQLEQSTIDETTRARAELFLRSREVSQIFNLQNGPPTGLLAYDQCHQILADYGLRSELAIPLLVRNEVYGSFRLYLKYPHVFLNDELEHAQILSEQITLALENARLHADLKLAAVTAERNRIAHDLHDSVTQTLFSASMISDILPTLWQRRPEDAMRRLTELRELTRGALAEMRTLLLELRPEALENIELPELLKQLATAFVGRSRVPLELSIDEECVIDHAARTALYRIAQETLNNVTKHANADHASLSLSLQGNTVELSITDDGDGFDPTHVRGNHLGLNIMCERAAEIGADLNISSFPQKGTKVSVLWTQTNKM